MQYAALSPAYIPHAMLQLCPNSKFDALTLSAQTFWLPREQYWS